MTAAAAATKTPTLEEQLSSLTKSVSDLAVISKQNTEALARASRPNYGGRNLGELFNDGVAPGVRRGENSQTSRPYSYAKALGWVQKQVEDKDARVEIELHNELSAIYSQENGYHKAIPNAMLMPLGTDIMGETLQDQKFVAKVKSILKGPPTDRDEVAWYIKKFGISQKTLSWLDESLGGSLVPPPQQMELIELLRNKAALFLAGASQIGMPPNGRAIWPRQTAAGRGFWVGEGDDITPSDQDTSDLILTAKKAGALSKVNNELFRFAGINVEQFVRNDLSIVLALLIDKTCLESAGSNKKPKGLINYDNITKHTASITGGDGDTFTPQDVYKILGKVFGKNANFTGWIMRPEMWAKIQAARWDTIQPGDGAGGFIWGLLRAIQDGVGIEQGATWHLGGYRLVQSNNVSNTRVKGGSSNLSYILGGDWPDYKIAMSGVVEIALNTQGDTAFVKDQTWIRAINYCDAAPAHEASFALCDQLDMS